MTAEQHAIAAVLEIIGVVLLAREVLIGHLMERLGRDMEFAARMLFHYTVRDYAGLMVLARLDAGDAPDEARKWLELGPEALEQGAELVYAENAGPWRASIERWEKRTVRAASARRRVLLLIGAACLIAATLMEWLA